MTLAITLIIITVIVSLLAFKDRNLMGKLLFTPYDVRHSNQWYRFITSGFIHADFMHLAINMFVFYSFGEAVENVYIVLFGAKGKLLFLALYIGAMIFADLASYVKHNDNRFFASLGASGAVSGVMFAFIFFAPWHGLTFIFFPFVKIPAFILGILYLIYSSYMSKKGGDRINHDAHFYGAVFGFMFTILLKPDLFRSFLEQITHP